MMKRPRSFISTLLIFFCLATVTAGLTAYARPADAGSTPRLMDPRAGDPNEPDPGLYQPGATTPVDLPEDSLSPIKPHSNDVWTRLGSLLTTFRGLWIWLLRGGKEGR